ncbi:MAG: HAMP domain-containing histidine kinase [bacterium]|nr:HAMP domain-containing histidine kinase [bacterium]
MRPDQTLTPEASLFVSATSLRHRLDWFNRLRWGAVVVLVAAVTVLGSVTIIPLPVGPMLAVAGTLALMNLGYVARNRLFAARAVRTEIRIVKLEMACDLLLLTFVLNLTGGVENPFLYVYVLHVVIAALLFKGREIFQITWLAIALFTAEVLGEHLGWLPHHHLLGASTMTHETRYIVAVLISFWFVMLSGAFVSGSIMRHNRAIRDELVARQRELLEADKATLEFFRFVTHEVKSPVNTARSAIEATLELHCDGLDPGARDLLDRAQKRLDQATEIVKDLADLTRTGVLRHEPPTNVDLAAVAARMLDEQRELAGITGQRLELKAPDGGVTVTTSEGAVAKILGNLVNNAVRYNRAGGPVTVTVTPLADGARLEVVDEGIGIAPGEQARVFDEFYRTAAAQQRSSLGTGLGLPIVHRLVHELGGAVVLHSVPDQGTTVTVDLPLVPPMTAGAGGTA